MRSTRAPALGCRMRSTCAPALGCRMRSAFPFSRTPEANRQTRSGSPVERLVRLHCLGLSARGRAQTPAGPAGLLLRLGHILGPGRHARAFRTDADLAGPDCGLSGRAPEWVAPLLVSPGRRGGRTPGGPRLGLPAPRVHSWPGVLRLGSGPRRTPGGRGAGLPHRCGRASRLQRRHWRPFQRAGRAASAFVQITRSEEVVPYAAERSGMAAGRSLDRAPPPAVSRIIA